MTSQAAVDYISDSLIKFGLLPPRDGLAVDQNQSDSSPSKGTICIYFILFSYAFFLLPFFFSIFLFILICLMLLLLALIL